MLWTNIINLLSELGQDYLLSQWTDSKKITTNVLDKFFVQAYCHFFCLFFVQKLSNLTVVLLSKSNSPASGYDQIRRLKVKL